MNITIVDKHKKNVAVTQATIISQCCNKCPLLSKYSLNINTIYVPENKTSLNDNPFSFPLVLQYFIFFFLISVEIHMVKGAFIWK